MQTIYQLLHLSTRAYFTGYYDLGDDEALLAYLEATFEDGDPSLIAAAIDDAARARWIGDHALSPDPGLDAVLRTLKSVDIGLTARAA